MMYISCDRCWGEGEVVTCWDDICANSDECLHGDGYGPCPDCDGTGEIRVDGADWEEGP